MDIEILHVAHCPNLYRARSRLREALQTAGAGATIRETQVSTTAAAERLGMRGSPTILIDGRDPFDGHGQVGSLSCRLYRVDQGLDGAPSIRQLIEVVNRSRRAPRQAASSTSPARPRWVGKSGLTSATVRPP